MVAQQTQQYDLQLETLVSWVNTVPWASRDHVTTLLTTPTLPNAILRYQEAPNWPVAQMDKRRTQLPSFVSAVLKGLSMAVAQLCYRPERDLRVCPNAQNTHWYTIIYTAEQPKKCL